MPKQKYTCEYCGDDFERLSHRVKEGQRIFCSSDCFYDSGRITRECQQCGKGFTITKSSTKHHPGKYCSIDCSNDARRTGGRHQSGYLTVSMTGHPLATKGGLILQHWLAMYQSASNPERIVQMRKDGWTIHHKNGVRDDNRIENLEWRSPANHPKGISLDDMADTLREHGYTVIEPEYEATHEN